MSETTPINAASFPALEQPPRLLLGPGPSSVHPRVYQAMTQPVVGHLDPTFIEVMDHVQALLRYLFQTENELTIPISGTGTAAMETCVANLVEPGDKVLVCVNGYFGQRLAEMAKRYGGDVATISKPWGQVFTPAAIDAALDEHKAQVVAIVHGETSTGAMQPMAGIAEVVHAHQAVLIVDTVASLGGVPFHVDALDIDACYTGSQKCLSAPPGSGPVTFGPRAVARLDARKTPVKNWYLDLTLLRKYWGPARQYHHTAPISATYALYEALRLIAEEGLEAVWARHRAAAQALWQGLKPLGLTPHVPEANRLPTLTTVRLPDRDGFDEAGIRRALLERYNIEIAGGLGDLKGRVWRVGLMGHSAREANVQTLLAALGELLT
ncbi:MAG: alanine--glyoxylate aminotransferase family protein [Anaerolineae bacterium]|nr:alanine--glyoxylate aminotransferase family protein [Anaerolineae bacterium]